MSIDIEAFPLVRFTGPLEIHVMVSEEAGRGALKEVRKALVLMATAHGLTPREVDVNSFEFSGPGPGTTPGLWWRRRLACWLMGLDQVALLSIRQTPGREGFRIRLEQPGS